MISASCEILGLFVTQQWLTTTLGISVKTSVLPWLTNSGGGQGYKVKTVAANTVPCRRWASQAYWASK